LRGRLDGRALHSFSSIFPVPQAVQAAAPQLALAVDAALPRIRAGGRLVYVGAGTSGRLGVIDSVELPPTFSWPRDRAIGVLAGGERAMFAAVEGAEDDPILGAADLRALGPTTQDVVLLIAASGSTPYAMGALGEARKAGALTIGLANNPGAPLIEQADIGILLDTGTEMISGSTRLKAATAQKIALNLLSTRVMSELGHIYQGLMVDMMPSNQKLVLRAHRMVAAIAGVSLAEAATAWIAAGRSIKCAVLLLDGHSLPDAEARLAQAKGRLDRARAQTAPNPAI
jgi:N-acetylmuramic acid 6-phosphate etherase